MVKVGRDRGVEVKCKAAAERPGAAPRGHDPGAIPARPGQDLSTREDALPQTLIAPAADWPDHADLTYQTRAWTGSGVCGQRPAAAVPARAAAPPALARQARGP